MSEATYKTIVPLAKLAFRGLGHKWQVTGVENLPETGGALLAINHTSYVDFIYAGFIGVKRGRYTRFMGKKELFDHRISGPIMRGCHHIAVDRANGASSLEDALRMLKDGELVGIYPEATISRSFELKEFKTGAARIAAEAGVPIIPAIVWGTHRMFTKDHPRDLSRGKTIALRVGEPLHPDGTDPVADTAELHARMQQLLDETIAAYPADEQPPGSWWLPKRFGGSAPTLAEAKELELAEKARRAARKTGLDASA